MTDVQDLPREWLLRDLGLQTAGETKLMITQAVQWGFDEPEGLTNQHKRWRWLRQCREKAINILAQGEWDLEPGAAQPVKSLQQRRAAKIKSKGRSRITAREANAWLQTLPYVDH